VLRRCSGLRNRLRVKRPQNCNPLILGASAAPKSIQKHRKSTISTIVSTIRTQKEEVAEEVQQRPMSPSPKGITHVSQSRCSPR